MSAPKPYYDPSRPACDGRWVATHMGNSVTTLTTHHSEEEAKTAMRWTRWCAFCDAAEVAPDTTLSPGDLALRYGLITGEAVPPEEIRQLMPETT